MVGKQGTQQDFFSPLVALASAFFVGGALGCVTAGMVDGGGGESLTRYLQGYLAAARTGAADAPGLLSTVWELTRWPLFSALLGLTALGVIALPVLFAARGFLLSFAIASFVRMFGPSGAVPAFVIFGLSGLLAIPVLFVLGVQSFSAARSFAFRPPGKDVRVRPIDAAFLLRCGFCAVALCICVLLERLVVPPLLAGAAGLFII